MKKIISAILALIMTITVLPLSVCAEGKESLSGNRGESFSWTLSNDELTIEYNGKISMYDLEQAEYPTAGKPLKTDMLNTVKTLNIGKSITEFSSDFFNKFENLEKINVDSNNNSFKSVDGILFSSNMEKIVKYPVKKANIEYEVPTSVKTIGEYSFADNILIEKVRLHEGIKVIGESAFEDCTSLIEYTIPESVEELYWTSFSGTLRYIFTDFGVTNIEDLAKIAETRTYTDALMTEVYMDGWLIRAPYCNDDNIYRVKNGTKHIAGLAFFGDDYDEVIMPNSLIDIGKQAFYYLTISKIEIPNSVLKIGDLAFFNCHNLNNVTIPGSVKEVGSNVFAFCNIERLEFCEGVEKIGTLSSAKDIVIPQSVKSIAATVNELSKAAPNLRQDRNIYLLNDTLSDEAFENGGLRASELYLDDDGKKVYLRDIDPYFSSLVSCYYEVQSKAYLPAVLLLSSFGNNIAVTGHNYFSFVDQFDEYYSNCYPLSNINADALRVLYLEILIGVLGIDLGFHNPTVGSAEEINRIFKTEFMYDYEAVFYYLTDDEFYETVVEYLCDNYPQYTDENKIAIYFGILSNKDSYSDYFGEQHDTINYYLWYKRWGRLYLEFMRCEMHPYDAAYKELELVEYASANLSQYDLNSLVDYSNFTDYGSRNITIHGYAKSGAEKFADKYAYKFVCEHSFVNGKCKYCGSEKCVAHEWSEWEVKSIPSCVDDGTATKHCLNCGTIKESVFPKIGHIFGEYEKSVEPVGCKTGYTGDRECKKCGFVEKGTVIPGNGKHEYVWWGMYSRPTCESSGSYLYVCAVCNKEKYDTIDPLPHTDSNHDGRCDNCGKNLTSNCSCNCHKSGISGFFFQIKLFFWKLFRIESNRYCSCGKAHW